MNIEKFIKKLRRAADALDELYIDDSSENRKVAQVEILEDKKKRKKKKTLLLQKNLNRKLPRKLPGHVNPNQLSRITTSLFIPTR